jgi:DNA-binding MarR family transcriptional regulator
LGYDSVTGEPQLSVLHHNDFDPNMSIREVFSFLSNEKHNVVIAIDEFQEICDWQDEKGEAALRTLVQSFPQLRFIFSGSNRKLMNEMFTHRKRPFYRSSELLFLPKIGAKDYINFASIHFRANSINIEKEVIGFVLDWCRHETYYIQRVLNRIYSQATKNMDREIILELLRAYLLEKESEFQVQLNLIPKNQRELITAIAIENGASQPTSAEFIKKYNLSSSSTVSQNLKSLVDKDLIEEEGEKYVVSDVFLNNWLRLK